MFFPRKIEEAKPTGASRAAIRGFAGQIRAKLGIATHQDVAKAYAKLGGKIMLDSVYGRDEEKNDEFAAFAPDAFLVALTHSMRLDEMQVRTFDTAKAMGHALLHAPGHFKAHGEGTAMIVARQSGAITGDDFQRVHDEARWFAWEVIAPQAMLDEYVASLKTTPEIAAWEVGHHFGLPVRHASLLVKSSLERLAAPLQVA